MEGRKESEQIDIEKDKEREQSTYLKE